MGQATYVLSLMTLWLVLTLTALDLSWEAPKGCPLAQEIKEQLEQRLGARAEHLEIISVIKRQNGRFILRTTIEGVERTLENRDCAALVRALVMMTTLLAQAPPANNAPQSGPAPLTIPKGPGPLAQMKGPGPLPDSKGAGPLRGSLGLGVSLRGGLHAFALPNPTFAVVPGVFLETGAARFELSATYLVQQQSTMTEGGVSTADFAGATAAGCYLHPLGAWQVGGCAGGSLGALRVATTGISEPGGVSAAFGWLFTGAAVRWHVGSGFSVFASLDASVHLTRPRFAIATNEAPKAFFQPAPVAMILQFGADFRWRPQIR